MVVLLAFLVREVELNELYGLLVLIGHQAVLFSFKSVVELFLDDHWSLVE